MNSLEEDNELMNPTPQFVVVTLGSNIDKERNLPAAVQRISRTTNVVRVSTVYESSAVGRTEQPNYFNAAVLLSTSLPAAALKDGLLSTIENELGRRRTADKFAPRTIDLDIALYGNGVFEYTPTDGRVRHIPDPDLLRFVHVTVPVAELQPDWVHPETGEKLSAIAERLLIDSGVSTAGSFYPRPDIDLRQYLPDTPISH